MPQVIKELIDDFKAATRNKVTPSLVFEISPSEELLALIWGQGYLSFMWWEAVFNMPFCFCLEGNKWCWQESLGGGKNQTSDPNVSGKR